MRETETKTYQITYTYENGETWTVTLQGWTKRQAQAHVMRTKKYAARSFNTSGPVVAHTLEEVAA